MYSLLIAGALSLSVLLGFLFIPEKPAYILGPIVAILAFFPVIILLSRRVASRVQPFFEAAQRLAKAGNIAQAIESLEGALRWSKWQLFLGSQIHGEIGLFHYANGDEKQAAEYLRKAYPKVSTSHLVLGAILYRDGQVDEACAALEKGILHNKKSPILYDFLAWIHEEEGRRDAAMEVLARARKADPADEPTADNQTRLQNDKKMNMRPFGDMWFLLKFETPKGMAPAPTFRKGFRQPPKAAKGRRR